MLTYSLQWLDILGGLLFAAAAIWVGSRMPAAEDQHRLAWRLTGAAFLIHAGYQVVQNTWGGLAMLQGADSPVMESYLRWAPALNHARTSLLFAFCVGLIVFAVRAGPGTRPLHGFVAFLVAASLLGALYGFAEGTLLERRHYLSVAGWDTVELVVLLGALLALLVTDRADRLLWGALATYAFSVALSILWFTALSRHGVPGAWAPAAWTVAAYRAGTMLLTLAFALLRVRAVRRRRPVPSLSPRLRRFDHGTLAR